MPRLPAFLVLFLALTCLTGVSSGGRPAAAEALPVATAPEPYVLAGTEVRSLRSAALDREYRLFVSLPESYATRPRRRYPVVFLTDADYAFPLVRSIAHRVGNRARVLEEFILVGLSYAVGDTPLYSRRRDYTPTPRGEKTPDIPGRKPVYGEAEAYRRFLADELMPFVAANYRTDTNRSIYAGHSYGGLFGLHVLLTEPRMFSHYILGSPSIWFDNRVMLAREAAFAEANGDLKASVYMAIGSYETLNPESGDRRYERRVDMIADMKALEAALRGRNYPGLTLTSEIIAGEDHLSVFPAIVTRGLLQALPAQPPRRSIRRRR